MVWSSIFQTLIIVLTTILFDVLVGVLISIKKGRFDLSILPQFIKTNVFPYMGGLLVLALLSAYLPEMEYLYYAAVGIVTLKFSKEALLDKIQELFS